MNEITPPALKNREEHPDNESIDAQPVDLVYLVCLVCLVQPANKIDQTDRQTLSVNC
jgi:hypothetical protein